MKVRITFKDPDGVHDSMATAVNQKLDEIKGLTERERSLLLGSRLEVLSEQLSRWIEFGEYVTIEFDTEANTCVVVPRD